MKNKKCIKRRSFLKTAPAAAIITPYIVPSSVFGADAPSNRLTLGCIGVGVQGIDNMNNFLERSDVQIVAVCDVDREHRLKARKIVEKKYAGAKPSGTYKGCDDYNDFREIIDRKDIDLVSIATPDHWHAIHAIMAANTGKDIYGEKPLALTIKQGRAMCDAVRHNSVVWQTGSWQRSVSNFIFACELVRNGRVGALHTIYVGLPSGKNIAPQPEMPVPDGFDYDFWLGPAQWAPYTEKRCHGEFRQILDYSGGQLTDWGAHHCDIAQWGMGTEHTGPVEIEGRGNYPRNGLFNTATTYRFECQYTNGVTMIVADSTQIPQGVKFVGTDGWVFVKRQDIDAEPKSLLTSIIRRDEFHLYETRRSGRSYTRAGEWWQLSSAVHIGNFMYCVKSREQTIAPIEVAHRSITIAHLGNIAMQLERKVQWDPDNERFVNDSEADRMLSRSMRAPWHI